ncbi:sulfurtransferase TusA family protein [Cellulosimicrobium sp. CUA-896]|uniref:sulfurtransferase TusA family protein n=1 Tax=Cellulosimicrobium sp. CUA-896 TaxID=1517881 RepID=UPI002100CD2F|nr:sulfurtransferase TusA family protein [Cellulosimicrobium sp. CUA-896]
MDARGLRCPLPVIRLAAAARDRARGERLDVWSTDPAARHDVPAWARMRGHRVVDERALPVSDDGPAWAITSSSVRAPVRDRGTPSGPWHDDAPGTTRPGRRAATGPRGARTGQLKEPPHAQALPALGLSIVKPCFSMVSAKSIVAPSR